MRFLNDNAFATPTWLLDESITRTFEAAGSIDRVSNAQVGILASLVANDRMLRMIELDAMPAAGERYTVPQMLADLRGGIWSEAATGKATDAWRRRLQRVYLEAMGAKVNYATPNLPPGFGALSARQVADLRGIIRAELRDLDRQLAAAIPRTSDRMTRAHFEDARIEIKQLLDPKN